MEVLNINLKRLWFALVWKTIYIMKTRIVFKSGKQLNVYTPKCLADYCEDGKLFARPIQKVMQLFKVDYVIFDYCL